MTLIAQIIPNKMNEENNENLNENFFDSYKNILLEYLEERVELMQLTVVEKTSILTAKLITGIVIIAFFMISFFFASIVLGLYLGEIYQSNFTGFLIVAAIYIGLSLFAFLFKRKLEKPIINLLIKQLLTGQNSSKN